MLFLIPDEFCNVTHLIIHMKKSNLLSEGSLPNSVKILEKWFGLGGSWLKSLLMMLLCCC